MTFEIDDSFVQIPDINCVGFIELVILSPKNEHEKNSETIKMISHSRTEFQIKRLFNQKIAHH